MSETDLYSPIIEAARVAGLAMLWRQQAGGVRARGGFVRLGPPGVPDLCGWMMRGPKRGAFVGLECKSKGEQATLLQATWRLQIEKDGGVAGVVYSVAEAVALLKKHAEAVS